MSSRIERERNDYHEILEHTQKCTLDITPWLSWFLGCLDRAIDSTETTLAAIFRKAHVWQHVGQFPLNERQRDVISRLLCGFEGKLTSSKYAKLTKCSADTALRDIRGLLDFGILRQSIAGGRSTSYDLAEL
ncbi:MAG: hypothetical protein FWD57_13325 [Polyangiaceae bacterium]|nr:hypothetical protein [Polyangiaceae bacterium]